MNRQGVKNFAWLLSKPFSISFLRELSGQNFIFPFYHLVAETPPKHIKNLYQTVTPGQFLNDLEFLLKYFRPATIADLQTFVRDGKKSREPRFFLSFDDGLRECFDVIFPILKQKGLEAAFFINPAFVGNNRLFYKHKVSMILETLKGISGGIFPQELPDLLQTRTKGKEEIIHKAGQLGYYETATIDQTAEILGIDFNFYLEKEKPYMSLEQIRELQDNGFLVGSHGFDHPKFWEITGQERKEQLIKSFDFIDQNLHPKIRVFAFPFSDFRVPASFFRFMSEELKTDVTFGTAGIKNDPQPGHIQRIPMESGGGLDAARIVRDEYAYYLLKSFIRKNTIHRP